MTNQIERDSKASLEAPWILSFRCLVSLSKTEQADLRFQRILYVRLFQPFVAFIQTITGAR